jgi:hypothetical protein
MIHSLGNAAAVARIVLQTYSSPSSDTVVDKDHRCLPAG